MAKGLDLFQQSSAGFTRQISPWDTDVCHCRSLLAGARQGGEYIYISSGKWCYRQQGG